MEENRNLKVLLIILMILLPLGIIAALFLGVRFYPELSQRLPEAIVGVKRVVDDVNNDDLNCEPCQKPDEMTVPEVPSQFDIVREKVEDGTIYLYYTEPGSFGNRNNFFITYPEFRTAERIADCNRDFFAAGLEADCANNIGEFYASYPNHSLNQSSYIHYKHIYGVGFALTEEISTYIKLVRPSDEIIGRIREDAYLTMTLNPENTKLYLVIQDIVDNIPSDSQVYEYDLATGAEKLVLEFKGDDYKNGVEFVDRIDGKYLTIAGSICYACDAPQRKAFVVDTTDFSQVDLGVVSDLKVYPQSGHATFLDEDGVYQLKSL